ncbi:hypothetical protein HZ326_17072 [Fusarium oxysporum f. sp. albedinis]|jgi:hypothetical protein|nr:hypothetical protein HZ326_17072 [Fusarium oxysporum f. sp. albedinis]
MQPFRLKIPRLLQAVALLLAQHRAPLKAKSINSVKEHACDRSSVTVYGIFPMFPIKKALGEAGAPDFLCLPQV